MPSDLCEVIYLLAVSNKTARKTDDISLRILRFLSVVNHSEFRSRRTLYKSVSIIKAKPIRSSTERKNPRVFSRYRGLLPDFLMPKGRRRPVPLSLLRNVGAPSARCGVQADVVRVYIIKEKGGKREGPGSKRTYRSLAKYRHAAVGVAQQAPGTPALFWVK